MQFDPARGPTRLAYNTARLGPRKNPSAVEES